MGLADALAAVVVEPAPKCTVCRVRLLLSPEDQAVLDDAIANVRISDQQVASALRAEGHDVTTAPVGRHRRGECVHGAR